MRKFVWVVCFVFAFALGAQAQGKIDSQWNCAKAAVEHSIDAGDQAGHMYMINQTKCTAAKGEIGGEKEKDGVGTEFHEAMPTKNTWHGVFVETLTSGDKIHYDYKGTGAVSNGKFASGNDTWTISGGTGKYKGAKGTGTCAGKGNPDGSSSWTCTGTISTAAATPEKKKM